jgi:hypothetical protein
MTHACTGVRTGIRHGNCCRTQRYGNPRFAFNPTLERRAAHALILRRGYQTQGVFNDKRQIPIASFGYCSRRNFGRSRSIVSLSRQLIEQPKRDESRDRKRFCCDALP